MRRSFRCRSGWLTLGVAVMLAPGVLASEVLVPVPAPQVSSSFGEQFLDRDEQGRVFLLQAQTLTVFEVTVSEVGGAPIPRPRYRLTGPAEGSDPSPVRAAVLEGKANSWVLQRDDGLFRASSRLYEALPPPGFPVVTLGRLGTQPVVSVLPLASRWTYEPGDPAPLLLRVEDSQQAGERWKRLADEGEMPRTLEDMLLLEATAHTELRTSLGTSQGADGVWVADLFRYRVRQYNVNGVLRWRLTGDLAFRRFDLQLPCGFGANLMQLVTAGLTEGPRGRLYILHFRAGTDGEDQAMLDRFDPVERKLERVEVVLDHGGAVSMVAGRDGLHLAARKGEEGRWFLSWEALEGASWRVAEGVEIGG